MKRLLLLFAALALSACVSAPEPCDPSGDNDMDQDGYFAADDCADDNINVYPGAFELCDGIDNDCDGEIDEIYGDADGDGILDCNDEEICDGLDNDGDTYIDEGYEDADGDGIADCVDDDCTLELTDSGEVAIDTTCADNPGEITDPWKIKTEWTWEGYSVNPEISTVVYAPLVGQLTDDNGDGVVNTLDTPDIVLAACCGTDVEAEMVIFVLSGDDGTELAAFSDPNGFFGGMGMLLLDVDNDGTPNIVSGVWGGADDNSIYLVAYEPDGTETWRASDPIVAFDYAGESSEGLFWQIYSADLDGDGEPEILTEKQVIDGMTGEQEFILSPTWETIFQHTTAADLDGDGTMEILGGGGVFNGTTGAELWTTAVKDNQLVWTAPIQYDTDAGAELMSFIPPAFQIYDDLLDLTTSSSTLGKQRGSDLSAQKQTILTIHATNAGVDLSSFVQNGDSSPSESDMDSLVGALEDSGTISYAHGLSQDLSIQAKQQLEILPSNHSRELLSDIVDFFCQRDH